MKITINCQPQPLQRHRHGKFGSYLPPKSREYREILQWEAKKQGAKMLDGAIFLTLLFEFEVPKSLSKKKKQERQGKPHASKPDLDNLVKAVLDAYNGILYADDSQITNLVAYKVWACEGKTTILCEVV